MKGRGKGRGPKFTFLAMAMPFTLPPLTLPASRFLAPVTLPWC